jgi:hypothetical protein
MQLRVARLCLDCEELYVGDRCPVCASEQYAFLSNWLPSEERRRWRRPAPAPAHGVQWRVAAFRQFVADLFGDGEPIRPKGPPRTRAIDRVPDLSFDEHPDDGKRRKPVVDPHPIKGHLR